MREGLLQDAHALRTRSLLVPPTFEHASSLYCCLSPCLPPDALPTSLMVGVTAMTLLRATLNFSLRPPSPLSSQ